MEPRSDSALYIHPLALCEASDIGEGTSVWAFAQVMAGAAIGAHCNICGHTFVEGGARIGNRVTLKNAALVWRGVTIEDDVFVGPGVVFTNDRYPRSRRALSESGRYDRPENWLVPTIVRKYASIGAGAVILPGVTVGAYALIGAGAVVTRDVGEHRCVAGNPAKPCGWACTCGASLDDSLACRQCRKRFVNGKDGIEPVPSSRSVPMVAEPVRHG